MEAAVVERAFIEVAGPDAEAFLQGQLSQDLAAGAGLSFLLDPTGKVVALLRFSRTDGGFLLDTDPEAGEAVLARLRRFLLRTKATVEVVEGRHLVRVFGAGADDVEGALPVAAWRPGEAVADLVVDDPDAAIAGLGATRIDGDEHERRRIEAGVPRSGVDIGPDTIPAEAGRWTIDAAVSFTKGCYTGQELVARIDSRGGNVPRPVRTIRFRSPVRRGDPIVDAAAADAAAVLGAVTSAAGSLAMAPLPRRVEVGDAVTVEGQPGVVEG